MSAKQRADRERVRVEAAGMFDQGTTPLVVARRLRVSTKSAYAWRRDWRAGGADALRSKGPGGAVCRLSGEQLGGLKADLEAGPAAFGWVDDQRWTAARVADLVAARFHIRYTSRGMDYLLHRIGYTPAGAGPSGRGA